MSQMRRVHLSPFGGMSHLDARIVEKDAEPQDVTVLGWYSSAPRSS
jgi:hypothetical protein